MGKITGGEVSYGRTMKTGDFENKRVDVKLSFSVEEGEDHTAILQAAAREAHDKAHAMLGVKKPDPPAEPAAKTSVPVTPTKEEAVATATAKADNLVKARAAKAAKVEKEVLFEHGGNPNALGETPADGSLPAGLKRTDPKAEPVEDLGFDEDAIESQPEITDAALSTAMNRKVAVLKAKHAGAAPTLIKALINTFVEPPKKSHDIPQNLRGEFLKKLEALE